MKEMSRTLCLLLGFVMSATTCAAEAAGNEGGPLFSRGLFVDIRPQRALDSGEEILFFDADLGGIPFNTSDEALRHNTLTLSKSLSERGSDATIIFSAKNVFFFYNGIRVQGLRNSVLQIDGELRFKRDHNESFLPEDPVFADPHGHPPACFSCKDCTNVTLTSSLPEGKRGILHGGGPEWWGVPVIGYVQIHENRPYFLLFNGTTHLNINNLVLQDSPFYNLMLTDVEYVEIHSLTIATRRTNQEVHGVVDLSAFNTDGIDIAGRHVHVHDVDIWNQDDCIAIKDNLWSSNKTSANMTFERIHASGLGLTIGSISGTTVSDIVFRDSYLYRTFKGIYMKFREPDGDLDSGNGLIENVHYENITMESPVQWPIWIGPAQQTGGTSNNLCNPSPCSLCWPSLPFQSCGSVPGTMYRNISLKDITIRNPGGSAGVILGGQDAPIIDLTFENVRVLVGVDGEGDPDLYSLFPGLTYPAHDTYARRTIVGLYVACILTIVGLTIAVQLYRWRRRRAYASPRNRRHNEAQPLSSSRHDEQSEQDGIMVADAELRPAPRQKKKRQPPQFLAVCVTILCQISVVVLSILIVLLTVQLIHSMLMIPTVDSPETYFVCEGVINGIAKGSTYPVPSCFEDQTTEPEPFVSVFIVGPLVRKQIVVGLFLLVCWLSYFIMVRKLWRRAHFCKPSHRRRRSHLPEERAFTDEAGSNERGDTAAAAAAQDDEATEGDSDSGGDDLDTSNSKKRTGAVPTADIFSNAWSGINTAGFGMPAQ